MQNEIDPCLRRPEVFAYSRSHCAMADSVQVAPMVVPKQSKFLWGLPLWQGAALLLLIAWLYASILGRLFTQWINDRISPTVSLCPPSPHLFSGGTGTS